MTTIEQAKRDLEKFISVTAEQVNVEYRENYIKCFTNTINTTIEYDEVEETTFILTGDIPAMWNRDSAAQIRPFIYFAKDSIAIQKIIKGIIKNYAKQIAIDPYANAFKKNQDQVGGHDDDLTDMDEIVWERKFEVDSLCYPIQLSYLYWKNTNDDSLFNTEFLKMMKSIVNTFEIEQNHEQSDYVFQRVNDWLLFENPQKIKYETLPNAGKGRPVKPCGLIWSGFRPSDDACQLNYLIPSNMFAVVILKYMSEIVTKLYDDSNLNEQIIKMIFEIEQGLNKYAIVNHNKYGQIYAYEVDGFGNEILMDDANVPSLLSLPYLGYCQPNSDIYANTRKFILSTDNQYYYVGKVASGIGSPHTPSNYAWHIANGIRGLTADTDWEVDECLSVYVNTDCGCGMYHEGYNVDNPCEYTRPWFSWSNSIFVELVLKKLGYKLEI